MGLFKYGFKYHRNYLIKGDLQTADRIKQGMLNDLQTFSEFQHKSDKATLHGQIGLSVAQFDPRVQTQ
ncbi:MAG: hypothetical protein IJ172_01575 [Ruminococcus sp.]|nr:hypothetical protein [Ruminococcus sp.]